MEELDLRELLMLFWNKKIQIIIIIAIFFVIGIIYTVGFVTPKYTSSTTLVLTTADNASTVAQTTNTITTTDVTLNSKLVSTYREIVKSKNIMRQVISNLKIDIDEEQLRRNVNVTSVQDTELIQISVVNENATIAAKIANEIAKVFTDEISKIYNINNIHIVDEAETRSVPSNINHIKDLILFTFIGVIIAVMYVLIANMLDTTIKTVEDVEKQFKIPVVATIPLYSFEASKKGGKKK